MDFSLSSSLVGNAVSNPDKLALDLQFATDKTLTARKGPTPVFTRGSSATFVDSDGLVKAAPENRVLQSENFSTTWVNSTLVGITSDAAISPIGDLTADQIGFVATGAPGVNRTLNQSIGTSLAGSNAVTASVWLRTISGIATVYISLTDGPTVVTRANTACALTTTWQRFSVTLNNPLYTLTFLIGPDTRTTAGSPAQPFPQAASSVYAWGAQVERSSVARTYIPTTTAAIYGPRFDHDPVTGVCKGLLIEESRTNASWYSGVVVVGTGWGGTEVTSSVDGLGPDGNNAYQVTETTVTSLHSLSNSGGSGSTGATSVVGGTTYAGSIFLKKVSGSVDWVQLTFPSAGFGATQYANFNIGAGTLGNSSVVIPRIENYGNGWYRCSITASAATTSSTSVNLITAFVNNTNGTTRLPSYAGNTANKILAAMVQFEAGSFATSYIPTTTASAIRSADVCSISGSGFTSMWNALEGSLFTSIIFNAPVAYGTSQLLIDVNDTTAANRFRYFRNSSSGTSGFANTSGGSLNVAANGSSVLQPFVTQKYSTGFKLDDYVLYVNNAQAAIDNLGAMIVSPTTMTIGDGFAAGGRAPTNGTISSIRYYKKRLLNTKLQAFTV